MNRKINILHLEDSLNDSELIHSLIESGGIEHDYFVTDSETEFVAKLENGDIDIILSDFNLPDFSGIEAFGLAREKYANIPFIFVSGTMGEDFAINAMVDGATDYVFKNKLERLVPAIKRAMHEIELNLNTRLAEKNLAKEKDLINSLMDTIPDHIYFKDLSGCFIRINKSHAESLGLDDPIQAIGKHDSDFFTEEHTKKAYSDEQTVIRTGQQIKVEEKLINLSGQEKWVSAIKMPLFDNKGNIYGTFGISRDITDRINAIELLQHAKEMAEASDKLKTAFLNNISHEVRTPLNGILGFSEIVFDMELSGEDKKESLYMLQESSDRLLNTITNYMDISLIVSGNLIKIEKTFIPGQVLTGIYEKFKTVCSDKKLELLLEMPEQFENISVNSDPDILRKILTHLLNNAVQFTNKGSIQFGLSIHDRDLEFFVKDSGIGIAKESIHSIFEHFIKESRDPSKLSEGSGLGLSIAKGMIEALCGTIRVESEVEAGSCFFFTIPFLKEAVIPQSTRPAAEPKKILSGASILVAEDDNVNFFYIQALIKQSTDAKIFHASNGSKAVELFKANPDIVLILMDIKMPEMDGYEATRQIKLINKDIPVIAITGYAMTGDEEKIRQAGCDGYLSKPISKKLLLEKMAEFVSI